MGFRFRKSTKLLPGVRLNLSKSGVSASVGRPCATINVSERGTRGTIGIPGTGMSYSENLNADKPHGPSGGDDGSGAWILWVIAALAVGMVLYGMLS